MPAVRQKLHLSSCANFRGQLFFQFNFDPRQRCGRATTMSVERFWSVEIEVRLLTHILIPTDGSEPAESCAEYAIALAKATGTRLTAVTVTAPYPSSAIYAPYLADTPELYKERVASVAVKRLEPIKTRAGASGVNCETLHLENAQPYQAIIGAANSRGCDLIVMASHGWRGSAAVVLGSETLKVLTHSTIPVLIVPPSTPHDEGAIRLEFGQPVEIRG